MTHTPASLRPLVPPLIVSCTYTAAASVAAVASGNLEFLFYVVVMLVLGSAVAVVHRHVSLSLASVWALAVWGALHMAGGLVPVPHSWPIDGEIRVLYSWWIVPPFLKYDHVVHAYGFGVTTWICWQGLRRLAGPIAPSLGAMTLCVAASLGFGALNEVIEFVATLVFPRTNVGGYVNTGWDLVSNGVGAIVAAIVLSLTHRASVSRSSRDASASSDSGRGRPPGIH
ncbi:MAG: DUF2238 domain-containing protein [Planctomycetes bacterium]|nr:DUF2238 domain-containing protein [Planctomycetota bacterium]